MDFYQANLAVFAAGNAYLLYRQYSRQAQKTVEQKETAQIEHQDGDDDGDGAPLMDSSAAQAARKFQIEYFSVYALAVAADWLQVRRGPQTTFGMKPLLAGEPTMTSC
jgi:hypothetical protein